MDYMPHSAFEAYPLVLESAKGLYYWDITGKRFFDGIGGIFTVSLGHGHPAVVEAATKQLEKMTFAPPMHGIADVTFDFIEKLSEVTPAGMDYVKTYSGASEAMESAIKFSRQYWKQSGQPGKYKFISRYQSYHGATMGAMSASGTGMRKTPFEPQMPGFLKLWPPTHMKDRLPEGTSWEEVNRISAHMFEDVILNEDPSTIAGIILEPIGNTGGLITPTAGGYHHATQSVCTAGFARC
jgi:adenosylmethionine-8-amino-7-oxononanoate aminotransferase